MKANIPGPPEDLVEVVAKEFPEAYDRGWNRLIGNENKAVVFQHTCGPVGLTILLNEYEARKKYRVGNCVRCQCFFYLGPL